MRFLCKHELLRFPGNLNKLITQFYCNHFSVRDLRTFGTSYPMVLRSQVSQEAEEGSQLHPEVNHLTGLPHLT